MFSIERDRDLGSSSVDEMQHVHSINHFSCVVHLKCTEIVGFITDLREETQNTPDSDCPSGKNDYIALFHECLFSIEDFDLEANE